VAPLLRPRAVTIVRVRAVRRKPHPPGCGKVLPGGCWAEQSPCRPKRGAEFGGWPAGVWSWVWPAWAPSQRSHTLHRTALCCPPLLFEKGRCYTCPCSCRLVGVQLAGAPSGSNTSTWPQAFGYLFKRLPTRGPLVWFPCGTTQELDVADIVERDRQRQEARASGGAVPSTHGSGGGAPSPHHSTNTDSADDARPTLYAHKPQRRLDELDRARFESQNVLGACGAGGLPERGCAPLLIPFPSTPAGFPLCFGQPSAPSEDFVP
jgi:hypothetical protein